MIASPRAVIFAGPSLPPACRPADPSPGYAGEGRAVLSPGIDWHPPVRQGELYQAALSRPAIIGIVDGYFEITPTVWHKEILWAMAQGIHVYGSASIGALRATELHSFGMKGIGRIFEAYRGGVLCDDDEVAMLHGPEELGYPAVTEAMVNIRATLDKAVAEGVLDGWLVAELTSIGKALFYKERSWDAIMKLANARGLPPIPLNNLVSWLPAGLVDQKRADALEMTAAICAHLLAGVTPLVVSYYFHDTRYHQAAAQLFIRNRSGTGPAENKPFSADAEYYPAEGC